MSASLKATNLRLDGILTDLLLDVFEEDGSPEKVTCGQCEWSVHLLGELRGHEAALRFHAAHCGRLAK